MAKEILCGFAHPGVRFVTMNELADDFARRSPRKR
jgi:peptidoglycan-N-acetylglucosamine deacetylase